LDLEPGRKNLWSKVPHDGDDQSHSRWVVVASNSLGYCFYSIPKPCRTILADPSHGASSPLLTLFFPSLWNLIDFKLLPTKVKKTNKKPKDCLIKQTKN